MIIYDLNCEQNHQFEGWFKNSYEFDKQLSSGLLTCPICGSEHIRKLPSASHLQLKPHESAPTNSADVSVSLSYGELARQIRDYISNNFEDVGDAFANEVRRIHYGETSERNIKGHATLDEINELVDEGIEPLLIPDIPDKDKLN